jgi:hypothetical protein
MALIAYQQIAATGLNPSLPAPTTDNTFVPDDRGFFWVVIGATSTNITLVVPGSLYGQARADVVLSGLTNTTRAIGPFVSDLADSTTGLCQVLLSQVTGVTAGAFRI